MTRLKSGKYPKYRYKGEQNDNYRANAYTLKCMYVLLLAFLFCWVLDILGIFIVDLKIMNIAIIGAVVFCVFAFTFAFVIGIDSRSSCFVIMFALVGMISIISTEMAYHTTMLMMFPLLCSAQYFDKRVTLYTCVLTCAGIACSVMVGYRIGLCDSNMLLLTYTTSAFHAAALESGDFVLNTDKSLMFLFFVFPRWLIVFSMMPLLNHVARDIQLRSAREAMARHMAEIDGLTGLYNRTKYLQDAANHYLECDSVAVLFFDVNNLKTLNDTKGHEYGDILICGLADALKARENENCRSYRIGGDEFVMVLEQADAALAEVTLKALNTALQGKQLESGVRLSVAIGMAAGKGKYFESLVKEADEKMYRNKQAMKN